MSSNRKIPLLTKAQLDWAVKRLNLRPSAVERLRAVLVDGCQVSEVSANTDMTTEATYRLIRQVSKELEKRLLDENKVMVTVIVNPEDAKKVIAFQSL